MKMDPNTQPVSDTEEDPGWTIKATSFQGTWPGSPSVAFTYSILVSPHVIGQHEMGAGPSPSAPPAGYSGNKSDLDSREDSEDL